MEQRPPTDQALVPATHVPAQVFGATKGRLAPGYDADVVPLDSAHRPVLTLVGGEPVFSALRQLATPRFNTVQSCRKSGR